MGCPVHQFLDHGVLCRLLHALQPDARQGRPRRPGQSGEDRGNLASGLCCVEQNQGGHDLSSLSRGFRSLVGLSADHDSIKSGIGRMGLRLQPLNERTIRENNENTLERARNRHLLRDRWNRAVAVHEEGRMTEEILIPKARVPKPYHFGNTTDRWWSPL